MTFTLANLNEEQIEFLKNMGEYDNFEHPYKTMYNLQSKFDKKVSDKHNLTYTDIEFGARNVFALFSEFGKLLDNRYEILEVIGTGGMAVVCGRRVDCRFFSWRRNNYPIAIVRNGEAIVGYDHVWFV